MKNTKLISEKILLFDGAMGTQLILDGAVLRSAEEYLLKFPEKVFRVHESYVQAGADIIETNTFGANRLKLAAFGREKQIRLINERAVALAKKAAGSKVLVAGSIGPSGHFLKPIGELSFDAAYENFSEQVKILAKAGVDLICIETMSDLAEARAALIAAKENFKGPLVVNLTFTEKGTTLTGTRPEVAAVVLKSIGAAAVGLNCGFGPNLALPLVEKLNHLRQQGFDFLISVLPNAGKPRMVGQKVIYPTKPEQFAAGIKKLIASGADLVGGCCGTTPEHIRVVKKIIQNLPPKRRARTKYFDITWAASPTRIQKISPGGPLFLIGDRINPSARPDLVKDLKSGQFKIALAQLKEQEKMEAEVLDINVSHPEIDEEKILPALIGRAQRIVGASFSIDTANLKALEAALKIYPGRPIINSTTGSAKNLKSILPLAKRFGALVIGLAFDEEGIASQPAARLKVAQKIIQKAQEYGIEKKDILIDPLVMALGTAGSAQTTLEAVKLIKKKLKVKTVLGIGNISHGLPNRAAINAYFLSLAINAGLDAAIANPLSEEIRKALKTGNYLAGWDFEGRKFLEFSASHKGQRPAARGQGDTFSSLQESVIDGDQNSAVDLVKKLLAQKITGYAIINKAIMPAMKKVGQLFSKGIYFLPQLNASAEAARIAMELCQKKMGRQKTVSRGRILIATVEGDIHDLGKNLVGLMLKNSGFEVIDLGKNVSNQKIIKAVKNLKPKVICLSALLTTTMLKMKELKKLLDQQGIKVPLVVGGAVVTAGFAKSFGAHYAKDAVTAVSLIEGVLKK